MTQDVRLAQVVQQLIKARASMFLAVQLLYADGNVDTPVARFPTNAEAATIAEQLEQVLKLSGKIARYIDIGPTCSECHRAMAAPPPSKSPCRDSHYAARDIR